MGKKDKVLGYVIYDGPSKYDSKPIIAIAIMNSVNPKTDNMIQIYIMRKDIAPHIAVKNGDDFSVCGKCPLRPISYKDNDIVDPCYVHTWQAPLSIWNAFHRGRYEYATPEQFRLIIQEYNKSVRFGAYGDPASVPFEIWQAMGIGSNEFNYTSYTHGYLMPNFDKRLLVFSMLSLDQVNDYRPELLNARTYRVINSVDQIRSDEILCPASKEQNYKTTCAKCGLCAGLSSKAKNIAIVSH